MKKQNGFTLVEMLIGLALLVPLFGLILRVGDGANRHLHSDDRLAKTTENLQRVAERVARLVRSASLPTIRVPAIGADVASGLAASVGQWITPAGAARRPGLRFQCAAEDPDRDFEALTSLRELRFEPDAGETANGLDDDADGLVDEGRVVLEAEGLVTTVVGNLESCTFAVEQRLVRLEMRARVVVPGGRTQGVTIRETLQIRNN